MFGPNAILPPLLLRIQVFAEYESLLEDKLLGRSTLIIHSRRNIPFPPSRGLRRSWHRYGKLRRAERNSVLHSIRIKHKPTIRTICLRARQ